LQARGEGSPYASPRDNNPYISLEEGVYRRTQDFAMEGVQEVDPGSFQKRAEPGGLENEAKCEISEQF